MSDRSPSMAYDAVSGVFAEGEGEHWFLLSSQVGAPHPGHSFVESSEVMTMTRPFRFLKALVFDWAGTTIDHGCRAPFVVFVDIFRRQAIEISTEQAREPMGMAKREHIAAITRIPDVARRWKQQLGRDATSDDVDRLYNQFLPLLKEILSSHSDVMNGVCELVAECRRRGLRIGSSTGYTHELVDVFAEQVAAQGYKPDCVICAEDVHQGRPAPWMLFEAARRLNVYPMWHVVKIDDTEVGVEAGRNAGCWSIGVTRTGNEVGLSEPDLAALPDNRRRELIQAAGDRLVRAGAQFVVESVADLMPVLDQIEARLEAGLRPGA